MTTNRDPDRMIHAFIREGAEQLHDQVYDAVRAGIEQRRQRAVIGPWRMPTLSKLVPIGLGAAAVVAVLFFGSRFIGVGLGSSGGPPTELARQLWSRGFRRQRAKLLPPRPGPGR